MKDKVRNLYVVCLYVHSLADFATGNSNLVWDWVNEKATKDDLLIILQKCYIRWLLNYWQCGDYTFMAEEPVFLFLIFKFLKGRYKNLSSVPT